MSNDNPPVDDVLIDDNGAPKPIEENLKSRSTWTRLLFMVISYFLLSLAAFVGSFIIILGFLWVLFTGEVNKQVRQVEFVDQIPKSASGKILRRLLRDRERERLASG